MGFMFDDWVLKNIGLEQIFHKNELNKERIRFEKELKKIRRIRN